MMQKSKERGLRLRRIIGLALNELISDQKFRTLVRPQILIDQLGVEPTFGYQHGGTERRILVIQSETSAVRKSKKVLTSLTSDQVSSVCLTYVCSDTVSFGNNVSSRSICRLSGVSRYLITPFVVTSFLCRAISRGTAIWKR